MHIKSEPAILYFGTPVVLISTVNEDGSHNQAPMSSAFWLRWRAILGLDTTSKTTENMQRTSECVLNLPCVENAEAVNRLARTTGSNPVPGAKVRRGYRFEPHKFETAGLNPIPSETVVAPRVLECPVQLEAKVAAAHRLADDSGANGASGILLFEVRILRVHLEESILVNGDRNRVDPDKWRPLIMSFQRFYGLEAGQVYDSTLAQIPEHLYRGRDIDQTRSEPNVTEHS